MTEQEQPRCPWCDEPLHFWLPGKEAERGCIECNNEDCEAAPVMIFGDDEADCIRKANDLKMVERVLREEREACCKAIRDSCTACAFGHSGEREADGTSIECMYCGVPIRAIESRFRCDSGLPQ